MVWYGMVWYGMVWYGIYLLQEGGRVCVWQTQTLPTSCRRYIILFYHVFFIQTQRYVHTSPRGEGRYDHTFEVRGGRYDHTFEVSEGRYETFETQEIYEFVFIKYYFNNFHLQGNSHNDIWYKNFQRFSYKVTL